LKGDPKFAADLDQALKERGALRGFDYLKFIDMVHANASLIPDESTRFKSAKVAAIAMGVTIEELLKTGTHCLSVIEDERTDFFKSLDEQTKEKIGASETKIVELTSQINETSEQIKKLQETINKLNAEKATLSTQVQDWKSKLKESADGFEFAYQMKKSEIEQNMNKISQLM
jgi:predicted nuclease with TOPRIM domain